MQAFTPVYLHREHTAPALMQTEYDGTSYSSMNEWLQQPNKNTARNRPVFRTSVDFPQCDTGEAEQAAEEQEEAERFPSLPRPTGPEDGYKRVYDNLTNQIAYRWPNPGNPRNREGCIGGTWRHIKEVLGHGGSRFVFVDGLVSVYDNQKFTEKLQAQLPYRPHIRPLYAPIKDNVGDATPRATLSSYPVLPSVAGVPASSISRDPDVERKLKLQERYPSNRRGVYGYKDCERIGVNRCQKT